MSEPVSAPALPDFQSAGPVPEDVIARLADRVPDEMVAIWREYGTGTIGDGFVRVIDPSKFEDLMPELTAHEGAIPLFTTALADVIVWRDGFLRDLRMRHGVTGVVAKSVKLFARFMSDEGFLEDQLFILPYAEARAAQGVPELDECFGYVPLLALGGAEQASSLRRMKLREHLLINAAAIGPLP